MFGHQWWPNAFTIFVEWDCFRLLSRIFWTYKSREQTTWVRTTSQVAFYLLSTVSWTITRSTKSKVNLTRNTQCFLTMPGGWLAFAVAVESKCQSLEVLKKRRRRNNRRKTKQNLNMITKFLLFFKKSHLYWS